VGWNLADRRIEPDGQIVYHPRTLYRSIDKEYVKINTEGVFPKQFANAVLQIRDQGNDTNRFTGQMNSAP